MGKSKWNYGCSIPILALSEAERKEAIHEWAEGNDSLERLLWNCYENKVVTNGCCAGEHHRPYVDFLIEESSRDALKQILDAADNRSNYKAIFLMSGGNPYSGPDWYKPILGISPCKERKSFFDDLNSYSENSNDSL